MSLDTILNSFATAVGTDIKGLNTKIGNLSTLTTAEKTNLVGVANELHAAILALAAGAAGIDDTKGAGDTDFTWSADKITSELLVTSNALKNEILGGASSALDTLNELAAALGNDENYAATIAAQMAKMVRVDTVQAFTNPEKIQGRANLGAASDAELQQFKTDVGDTTIDLVGAYNTAKA